MSCTINNTSPIKRLYFKASESILNTYNIPSDKRIIISGESFLSIPLDSSRYTRVEEGEKSKFRDSFRTPFIIPRNIRVGFTANIDDNFVNVRRCLEFLGTSSLATSNTGTYIPVTVLDYIRPEIADPIFTRRIGQLILGGGTGFSGTDINNQPLYTEPYDINFLEIYKRFIV